MIPNIPVKNTTVQNIFTHYPNSTIPSNLKHNVLNALDAEDMGIRLQLPVSSS